MLDPPTHLTCPFVFSKSPLSMVRSMAVRLSSMWAEVFRHFVMVSYKDRESVTAINGTSLIWFSHCPSCRCRPKDSTKRYNDASGGYLFLVASIGTLLKGC